jgi:hypothetical protein
MSRVPNIGFLDSLFCPVFFSIYCHLIYHHPVLCLVPVFVGSSFFSILSIFFLALLVPALLCVMCLVSCFLSCPSVLSSGCTLSCLPSPRLLCIFSCLVFLHCFPRYPLLCPIPSLVVCVCPVLRLLISFTYGTYIYLSRVLCLSSVSQLRNTAVCFMLDSNNQTDQGDETEGLKGEGLKKGDVKKLFFF